MPEFAPVAPPELLLLMKKEDMLGKYHLLLAHDVVARPELYKEVFDDVEKRTIIMDNSLIELGSPVSVSTMAAAVEIVLTEYVVLPDHLGQSRKTIEAVKQAADDWVDAGLDNFMVVIQGSDLRECMWCIEEYIHMIDLGLPMGAWSVPKIIGDTLGSRREICSELSQFGKPIHLLGFTNDLEDDSHCAHMPFVQGIDSAVPLRLGVQNIRWHASMSPEQQGGRGNYWEEASKLESMPSQLMYNLTVARRTFK